MLVHINTDSYDPYDDEELTPEHAARRAALIGRLEKLIRETPMVSVYGLYLHRGTTNVFITDTPEGPPLGGIMMVRTPRHENWLALIEWVEFKLHLYTGIEWDAPMDDPTNRVAEA